MAETSQNLGDKVKASDLNPPVTMKVDAPEEDSNNQEVKDNNKNENLGKGEAEFKICSPSNKFPASNATTNPFANTDNKSATRGILKPPQLSLSNTNNTAKSSFVLNPSRLNPFAKTSGEDDNSNGDKKSSQINGEVPKFVPLVQNDSKTTASGQTVTTTTTTNDTIATNSSFVFGQNLQERVIAAKENNDEPKPSTSLNSNGTASEMLFSSAIKNDVKLENSTNKEVKSLSESAREYEESRANKRKYEEVEVITGEEGETNVLNITCKLFAFDKASGSWQERGRGVLRLNDIDGEEHTQSRLVFRTTGSLRVVLNTKIWAEMTVEQASEKSVRFTALDANGVIKVFLAMASIDDSKQLYLQIQSRVKKEIAAQKHKKLSSEKDSGGK